MLLLRRCLLGPGKNEGFSKTSAAFVHHHKERWNLERFIGMRRSNPQKANRNTHWNERRFRHLRALKTMKIRLPDFEAERKFEHGDMNPGELRRYFREMGINPYEKVMPRHWKSAQQMMHRDTIGEIVSHYVPRWVSPFKSEVKMTAKLKDYTSWAVNRYWRSRESVIRKRDGMQDFRFNSFATEADHIFLEAHRWLMQRDQNQLLKYVTPTCLGEMWSQVENGTVVWEYVDQLSPSKVVLPLLVDIPAQSGNTFAQLTVQMHSRQKLALYDRFGRLLVGSEDVVEPVLEFVVFERHISSIYGEWRIAGKVYPKWATVKKPLESTFAVDRDAYEKSAQSRELIFNRHLAMDHNPKDVQKPASTRAQSRREGRDK